MKKGVVYTASSVIILLICVVAFVLPSTLMNGKSGDQLPAFGKFNGKEIKYEQGSTLSDYVSRYGQMFQAQGTQLNSNSYYYIFSYAFNATVQELAFADAVNRSGYKVPKSAINRNLVNYFVDENGNFSSKIYKQAPASEVATLQSTIEKSLVSSRFYEDNFGSQSEILGTQALYGLKESDAELDFIQAYNDTKRGFDMAVFEMSSYPDEEKAKYGKAHSALFTTYDMQVITCENKSAAEKALNRINNDEITFADAVSEYSSKAYSNTEGKVTIPYQYQIERILEDKADVAKLETLKKGEKSPVVKTLNGYSFFMANEDPKPADFNTAESLSIVHGYLTAYEVSIIEDYFTAKAKDFASAAKSSFDSACSTFGIEKVTIAPFPLNYGSATISQSVDTSTKGLTNADSNENFLKTAFSLKKDEISAPLLLNNNVIVLKYTVDEKNTEEDDAVISQLTSYDENSSTKAIMNSPKFENNFAEVYFNYLMNN